MHILFIPFFILSLAVVGMTAGFQSDLKSDNVKKVSIKQQGR